jgi:hypothetical protein
MFALQNVPDSDANTQKRKREEEAGSNESYNEKPVSKRRKNNPLFGISSDGTTITFFADFAVVSHQRSNNLINRLSNILKNNPIAKVVFSKECSSEFCLGMMNRFWREDKDKDEDKDVEIIFKNPKIVPIRREMIGFKSWEYNNSDYIKETEKLAIADGDSNIVIISGNSMRWRLLYGDAITYRSPNRKILYTSGVVFCIVLCVKALDENNNPIFGMVHTDGLLGYDSDRESAAKVLNLLEQEMHKVDATKDFQYFLIPGSYGNLCNTFMEVLRDERKNAYLCEHGRKYRRKQGLPEEYGIAVKFNTTILTDDITKQLQIYLKNYWTQKEGLIDYNVMPIAPVPVQSFSSSSSEKHGSQKQSICTSGLTTTLNQSSSSNNQKFFSSSQSSSSNNGATFFGRVMSLGIVTLPRRDELLPLPPEEATQKGLLDSLEDIFRKAPEETTCVKKVT